MRIFAALTLCILLSACSPAVSDESRPTYCDHDNFICSDGSIVMRTGVDCAFVCPEEKKSDFCDYGSPKRDYWHHDLRECASAVPQCDAGWEQFSDHCGCGCEKS